MMTTREFWTALDKTFATVRGLKNPEDQTMIMTAFMNDKRIPWTEIAFEISWQPDLAAKLSDANSSELSYDFYMERLLKRCQETA